MPLTLRQLRLKAVWLLVLPFLWFATPTIRLVVIGGAIAAIGLFVRGWSAGTIYKDEGLAVTGPYAFTRNPLYLGSFLIGIGVTVAGGHWLWPVLFLAFFVSVYIRTVRREERHLSAIFPADYAIWAAAVPAVIPRMTPWRPEPDEAGVLTGQSGGAGFSRAQYMRNREWEALLGAVSAFAFLAVRSTLP